MRLLFFMRKKTFNFVSWFVFDFASFRVGLGVLVSDEFDQMAFGFCRDEGLLRDERRLLSKSGVKLPVFSYGIQAANIDLKNT